MPSLVVAIGAAALASQAAPQLDFDAQTALNGGAFRLTLSEMASVTSAPVQGPVEGMLHTPALRLNGSEFAYETGVRTIAVSNGIGSTSQAATNLNVQVTLTQSTQ
ncbi:MAG TPA: hypothetical protein VIO94_07695 [Phenylobacterium sp.]